MRRAVSTSMGRRGDGLAWGSPAENIDALEFASNGSNIFVAPHMWPVLRQHGPAKWVDLNLPLDLEAGALEPKIEPSDT
jgi:hypothetical protein